MIFLKQSLFLGLIILMGSSLTAQSFAIKGGLNMANISTELNDANGIFSSNTDPRTTFNLGVTADFPLGNVLSIESGLIFQNRGYVWEYNETILGQTAAIKSTNKVAYVDIPLTLKASLNVGSASAYVFGGGYAGLGVFAERERETTLGSSTNKNSEDIEFGEDGGLKRLDYGTLVGVGVQLHSLFIETSYSYGLANIYDTDSDDNAVNNRLLSLSLGYRFH